MLSFQHPLNGNENQGHDSYGNGDQSENNNNKLGSNFTSKNVFQKNRLNHKNSGKKLLPEIPKSTGSSQSLSGRLSRASNFSHDDLNFDQSIGGFDTNLNAFQNFNHIHRSTPKYLLFQSPGLEASPIYQDDWDKSNQEAMFKLEQNTSDVSTLYEDFQKMRDNERKVMEQKGLVDKEDTRKTLEDAISFQGSCLEMCPVYERIRRSIENDVRKYEKDPVTGKISSTKAIKAFSRPAAGQPPPLPSDVRPPQVLLKTLNYIVDHLLDKLPEAQSFIWDRTRSIRQDFTYQNYFGPEAMDCNERIVRIHILTLHVMAKTKSEFSQQQELEQMNKALKTLSEMYAEYRSRGIEAPNEAEFRAYYLISQLRDPELDREIQSLPDSIIKDEKVQLALNLRNLVQTNIIERGFQPTENVLNFYKNFFQNFAQGQVPILLSYLLEIHLNEIRFYAIKSLKRSIHSKSKPFPSEYMINLLAFNDFSDLSNFANHYGLQITQADENNFIDILSLSHPSHSLPDQKPLAQAFYEKHDSKVPSFKSLIQRGVLNLEKPGILTTGDLKVPLSSSITTSDYAGLSQRPQQQVLSSGTSGTSGFSFSFPQGNSSQTTTKFEEDQAAVEGSKKLQEREASLKKKLEQEKLKREQQRTMETQRKQEEENRLRQLENERIKKEQTEKQRKADMIASFSQSLTESIITSTVRTEVTAILKPLVDNQAARKKKKELILDSFSKGLFEAFVSELAYIESLNILAENFKNSKLKMLAIKKICRIAKESKEKIELKKRKREEFLEASKTFGLPKVITKRKKLNHNKKYNSVKEDESQNVMNKIDLHPLDFGVLLKNLKESMIDKYEVLIFFQDLNTARSIFLRKKFFIDKLLEISIPNHDNISLKVMGTNQIDPTKFDNVNLFVFNCDGVEKIREQRILLKELINGISLNSNVKFQVLIIFWELKGLMKLSKNEILNELNFKTNDAVLNVDVLKIDDDLRVEPLQNVVDSLGTKFGLTAKGEYNLRYNHRKVLKNNFEMTEKNGVRSNSSSQLKGFNDDKEHYNDNKIYKHLQKHIEASPKRAVIPKLLSNFNKSSEVPSRISKKNKIEVYSTPRPKSSDLLQTPSFYNDSTGSSISNLSNITFANQSTSTPINIISKPSYAKVVKDSMKQDDKKDEPGSEGNIPKSILELRKLAESVRQRHGKKKE